MLVFYSNSFCDPGRGDDDESIGRREGDGDEGRRMMEQELVEGSVTMAAASALASAATKAKVKPTPLPQTDQSQEDESVVILQYFSVAQQLKPAAPYEPF